MPRTNKNVFFTLKEKHLTWAEPWQADLQNHIQRVETVSILGRCFIADNAALFAEPGRTIEINHGTSIGAHCFIHGPVTLGESVSLNPWCHLDGGRAGIKIGKNTRIGAHTSIFAFNHGMNPGVIIRNQPTVSKGIRIGCDVWIGARVGIVDGVQIGDHAVIGMGSIVTRNVQDFEIVAGNPAHPSGSRLSKGKIESNSFLS